MNTLTTATRRTPTISGILLALAIAVLFGTALVPGVDAKEKTTTPINVRVHIQIHNCADFGGTASVKTTPFGAAITTCTGGDMDGETCVNTKKSTSCSNPQSQPLDPAGNTPALPVVDPSQIPEQPLVAASTSARGAKDGDQDDARKHRDKRKHHRGERRD
jgi:hypothetical protein